MSADPYSRLVREYFSDPAHCGDLEAGQVADISDQGMHVCLAATHGNGRIEALRFRAWGCPHLIAACEAFCRGWEGRCATELLDFKAVEIMRTLSVPVEKTGRILVLEDAVRSLGQSIRAGTAT